MITLTREQYDKMIENKDAALEYQRTNRSWFLGGVRISGTKETMEAIEKYLNH